MNPIHDRYLADPAWLDRMLAAARRERSQAIGRAFSNLFALLKGKNRHAARTHLAAQG